jgi:hypothetical protein
MDNLQVHEPTEITQQFSFINIRNLFFCITLEKYILALDLFHYEGTAQNIVQPSGMLWTVMATIRSRIRLQCWRSFS